MGKKHSKCCKQIWEEQAPVKRSSGASLSEPFMYMGEVIDEQVCLEVIDGTFQDGKCLVPYTSAKNNNELACLEATGLWLDNQCLYDLSSRQATVDTIYKDQASCEKHGGIWIMKHCYMPVNAHRITARGTETTDGNAHVNTMLGMMGIFMIGFVIFAMGQAVGGYLARKRQDRERVMVPVGMDYKDGSGHAV